MRKQLYRNHIPSYVNVYNSLYSDIINDVYLDNELLPSESILAEKYGVSRNTLRQALAILCEDGLIVKSQGKGTLVTKEKIQFDNNKISNPMINLCTNNIDDIIIHYNFNPPTDIAKAKLGLNKSDIVLASTNIYKSQEIPLGYSFAQIPIKVFHELNVDSNDEESISNLINHKIFEVAARSKFSIKLILANEIESNYLGVNESTPLLLMESIFYNSKAEAFARYKFYFNPQFYKLHFQN